MSRMSAEARTVYVERRQADRDATTRHRAAVRRSWADRGVLL